MLKLKYITIVFLFMVIACNPGRNVEKSERTSSGKYSSDPIHVQATDYIIEGKRAELQANYVLAEDNYLKCLKVNPLNSTAHYLLSRLYQSKNVEKSLNYAKKAVELDPNETCFQDQLILVYKQMKDWQNAAKWAQIKIKKEPFEHTNYYDLANIYIYSNQPEKALNVYQEYEQKFGFEEGIILQKKQLYLSQKNYGKAVAETEKLINHFPDKTDYLGMAADIYQAMGNKEKAFEYYSRILKLNPDDGKVHLSLSDYYLLQGDKDRSIEETKKAIGSKNLNIDIKIPVVFKYLGEASATETAFRQSEEMIDLLVKTHPTEAKAIATQADFYNQNKRFYEARKSFRRVIELDSSKYLVWEQLLLLEKEFADYPMMLLESQKALAMFSQYSLLYYFNALANYKMGNYSAAEESLEAGKMFCYSPRQQSEFFVLSAKLQYIKGNTDIAKKYLESAIQFNPKCSSAYRTNAELMKFPDEKSSYDALMKALELDSMDAVNYLALAMYYYHQKRVEETKIYLQKAVNLMPINVEILEFEGDFYQDQNKSDEAVAVWKKALEYSEYRKKEIEIKIMKNGK